MACVHRKTDFDTLLPKSFFSGSLETRLASALALSPNSSGLHSFTIASRMLHDPAFVASAAPMKPATEGPVDPLISFPLKNVLDKQGELIRKYAEQWIVDTNDKKGLRTKVEELRFLAVLLYGVAGLQKGKDFNADFFTWVCNSCVIHYSVVLMILQNAPRHIVVVLGRIFRASFP